MPEPRPDLRPDLRPDPRREDIMAGDRRLSRPDASLPDWEVPDCAYRPIPIVWFTAAMLAQMVGLSAVFWLLAPAPPTYAIALAGALTGVIGAWTWQRGMARAALGWRAATLMVLTGQLGFILLALGSRI